MSGYASSHALNQPSMLSSANMSRQWAAWIPALQTSVGQSMATLAILADDEQCDALMCSMREAQLGETVSLSAAFDDLDDNS